MDQAAGVLLGEIDEEKTGDGQIDCKEGFAATTITPDQFRSWAIQIGLDPATDFNLIEIDESSLFCEMGKADKSL